jgi:hypothetical protein
MKPAKRLALALIGWVGSDYRTPKYALQGTVSIANGPSGGARVTLRLPRATADVIQ